ncbi:efflux RND transporter periplasmic adaptor subunit [Mucilaginibacter mali]|uniref:Efflux RND transporter periplasmic adaptor subunit n=2 Tax=Mucilaginibacter mali TaxID=2740462 RepID=A0A7D4Q4N8_9SPHI|nr:efflux RND transporter periplasmic adaptor subunit [Mucilaginibacter mali]
MGFKPIANNASPFSAAGEERVSGRSHGRLSLSTLLLLAAALFLSACSSADKPAADEEVDVKSQTPVTITTIDQNAMTDYVEMNATSVFQQKNYVKANANGYIEVANAKPGQMVSKGTTLFTIKTKEAQSIGNSINILDTTFKFSGVNKIKASQHGYITQLNHQVGDYVQDGEQLAIISDESSFAFVLQVPYEYRALVKLGQDIPLTLPDGEKLTGHVASLMPAVDTLSQTQGVVLKVNSSHPIPENLTARAKLVKTAKQNTVSLPKQAVLANETQTEFWVMKLIKDTLAVKVPVTKGIETSDRVEILSPQFTAADRIVVTGNYGLSDTAKVKIVKP